MIWYSIATIIIPIVCIATLFNNIDIDIASATLIATVIIGVCQIYLSNKMSDFEKRQNAKDEKRRHDAIFAESTRFIQKYSANNHESEILLLPFCVTAYKYNPMYPYRREIYREFCTLTEDVQNEILQRQKIDLVSKKYDSYYQEMLRRNNENIHFRYPNDNQDFSILNQKYFEVALTAYGEEIPLDDLTCTADKDYCSSSTLKALLGEERTKTMPFKQHISNMLDYHAQETPLSELKKYIDANDNIIQFPSYVCCTVAKYTSIYSYQDIDDYRNLEYPYDFTGTLYMEDLFLDALFYLENKHPSAMVSDRM